jgi:hypothetical protein
MNAPVCEHKQHFSPPIRNDAGNFRITPHPGALLWQRHFDV